MQVRLMGSFGLNNGSVPWLKDMEVPYALLVKRIWKIPITFFRIALSFKRILALA